MVTRYLYQTVHPFKFADNTTCMSHAKNLCPQLQHVKSSASRRWPATGPNRQEVVQDKQKAMNYELLKMTIINVGRFWSSQHCGKLLIGLETHQKEYDKIVGLKPESSGLFLPHHLEYCRPTFVGLLEMPSGMFQARNVGCNSRPSSHRFARIRHR
jgi:hypothetical protein